MKPRSFLLLFILALPLCLHANHGRSNNRDRHSDDDASTLSVFSDNGEQFFLVVNGINQNNVPSSKVRVKGLEQYDNDIEIIFADRKTQSIHKKVNIADPMDGNPVDMILKIVRNPIGYPKLMFYSCIVTGEGSHSERDEYVAGYVKPAASNAMNNNAELAPANNISAANTVAPQPTAVPDDKQIFSDLKKTISGSTLESERFATAQTILTSKTLTTSQVIEICNLFSFDNTKLAFAKLAYSKVTDPNNYSRTESVLKLSANQDKLKDYIDSNKR